MTLAVGSILKKRKPEGDAFDRLRVVGAFDVGEDHGGSELVVTGADEFTENYTAAESGIGRDYDLESEPAPVSLDAWEAGPDG